MRQTCAFSLSYVDTFGLIHISVNAKVIIQTAFFYCAFMAILRPSLRHRRHHEEHSPQPVPWVFCICSEWSAPAFWRLIVVRLLITFRLVNVNMSATGCVDDWHLKERQWRKKKLNNDTNSFPVVCPGSFDCDELEGEAFIWAPLSLPVAPAA